MMELIRNCGHGSEIAIYLRDAGPAGKAIVKTAYTADGIADLRRECAGWSWYGTLGRPQARGGGCRILLERSSFLEIEIGYVEGVKGDYRQGLSGNASLIEKVVDHYCHLWPRDASGMGPLHGDLSVDNIIVSDEGVYIIDWEHFNPAGAPWGFDLVYLLLESFWFGVRKRKRAFSGEIELVATHLKRISATGRLSGRFVEQPLWFVKDYIASHPETWGKQAIRPADKFPIFHFDAEQTARIDNTLREKLGG